MSRRMTRTTASPSQMHTLRKIMQGDTDLPKAPLGNNFRPIQTLNQRFLRTNIDFKKNPVSDCLPDQPIDAAIRAECAILGLKLLTPDAVCLHVQMKENERPIRRRVIAEFVQHDP